MPLPWWRRSASWLADRDGSTDRPLTVSHRMRAVATSSGRSSTPISRSGVVGWR